MRHAWKRAGAVLGAAMLALWLGACAHGGNAREHALIGKVWDASEQRFVEPADMIERAAATRFVLLGEIHDNAEHHRIQTHIFEELLRRGRRPALVMEQYDLDQADKIQAIRRVAHNLDHKLSSLGALMRAGWDWPFYQPLVRLALHYDLPLAPANLSRTSLRQIARGGFAALAGGEDIRLALDAVWSAPRETQLLQEVHDGHCGKLPAHVVETIAKAQRVRDAAMADALLAFAEPGAVAILGKGHARLDMGVPLYLQARAPLATVLSLGMVQVDDATNPAAYAAGPLGHRFDYVWFTAATKRASDPCDSIPAHPAPAASSNRPT